MIPLIHKRIHCDVAEVLLQAIRDGTWTGRLPGYRELMLRLGVGRPAILKALAELTAQGVLHPPDGQKRRFVKAVPPAPLREMPKRVMVLGAEPHVALEASVLTTLNLLRESLSEEWEFNYLHFPAMRQKSPGRRMAELVHMHQPAKWILVHPDFAAARWAAENAPNAICFGGDTRSLNIPCVSTCYPTMCCALARLLLEAGHRRISIILPITSPEGRARLVGGLRQCFGEFGARFDPDFNAPAVDTSSPSAVWSLLTDLFRHTPPTAIGAYHFNSYLLLQSFCCSRGLRIAEDVSVTVYDDSPAIDWIRPRPVCVSWPVTEFARLLKRWLEQGTGALPSAFHLVAAHVQPGETIRQITCSNASSLPAKTSPGSLTIPSPRS